MGLPEKDIKKQIRDVLNACGVWHYNHYNGGGFNPKKGISDIIGIQTISVKDLIKHDIDYVGRYLAIEVKKEDWMPPNPHMKSWDHYKEQKDFLDEVNRAGGKGFFANCPEDVIRELNLKAKLMPLFG